MVADGDDIGPVYQFQPQSYRINDVVGWQDRSELVLSPDFQRRRIRTRQGKSYLIDSIIRGIPIPQFFIRETIHVADRRTVREVIDGQQRISSILDFIDGKFTILPSHNNEYARTVFDQLPDAVQQAFLSYPLSINIITTADKGAILEIFSRINSYSIPTNRPERLNAKYTGAFKKSVHELARAHLAFWERHEILSKQGIARMLDVDLTGDLVVTMIDGLQQQKSKVDEFYKKFDEEFPFADELAERFGQVLVASEAVVGVSIEDTVFRRPALFYSIFTALYEIMYGFGEPTDPQRAFLNTDRLSIARDALQALGDLTIEEPTPEPVVQFVSATLRSTDKLPQRTLRHDTIRALLEPAFD